MPIQHISPISGVACWERRYVATAGYDNLLLLWDAATRQPVARATHDHLVNQCVFSSCGAFLASASSDHTARLWTVPSLSLVALYGPHDDDVEMVDISPDGTRVATGSRDCRVRIFARSGRLLHVLAGHESDVISVQWSPDGRHVASSSDDGSIRLWDPDGGSQAAFVDLGAVETDTIAFADDGVVFGGNDDGEIITLRDGHVANRTRVHEAGIKRLVWNARDKSLLSLSYDRSVALWRFRGEALEQLARSVAPPCIWSRSAAFDADGRIVLGTFGSSYAVYDPSTGAWDTDAVGDTPGINAVALLQGEVWTVGDAGHVRCSGRGVVRVPSSCNFLGAWRGGLVTGGHTGELFDAQTGALLYRYRSPLNCAVEVDDDLIIGTYTGEAVRLARDASGVTVVWTTKLHDNAIKSIASDDGQLFSVCASGDAAFHDPLTGRTVARMPRAHERIANGAVAIGAGRFASVSRDRRLRLWSNKGTEVVDSPHSHSIKCLAADRVSGILATGAYDGTVAFYSPTKKCWLDARRISQAGISSLTAGARPGTFLASSYDSGVYEVSPDSPARLLLWTASPSPSGMLASHAMAASAQLGSSASC
jgi:toxoflavin biosynthesis protein ToxC